MPSSGLERDGRGGAEDPGERFRRAVAGPVKAIGRFQPVMAFAVRPVSQNVDEAEPRTPANVFAAPSQAQRRA